MKRFCLILTVVLLVLACRSYSFAGMMGIQPFHVRFTRLTIPQHNFFFGNPLKVIDIEYFDTQLDKKINKYVHIFKVTILRPSNDDGRGTTKFYGDWYRLYYWAAENKFSPAIAIRNGMKVYQDVDLFI